MSCVEDADNLTGTHGGATRFPSCDGARRNASDALL